MTHLLIALCCVNLLFIFQVLTDILSTFSFPEDDKLRQFIFQLECRWKESQKRVTYLLPWVSIFKVTFYINCKSRNVSLRKLSIPTFKSHLTREVYNQKLFSVFLNVLLRKVEWYYWLLWLHLDPSSQL